jgi:chromosome segregation ATPase
MAAVGKIDHAVIAMANVRGLARRVSAALKSLASGQDALKARVNDLEKRMDAMTQTQGQLDTEITQVATDEQSLATQLASYQQTVNAQISSLQAKAGGAPTFDSEIQSLQTVDAGLQQMVQSLNAPAASAATIATTSATTATGSTSGQ